MLLSSQSFSNKLVNYIAFLFLVFVFLITVFSIKNDSLTMDELAHLPAGYSYLTQKDMRLNPEHPPLIKDFSAFPLLFIKNINFPYNDRNWTQEINGQWGFGNKFLFKSDNPAEKMIFWARIPMILLLLLTGFFIFRWTKELFGNKAALLALFLFSFSPTFLAHGRLVTTDVGAAFGVLFATYYFIKFLKDPSKKNLLKAGLALGVSQLLKFSLILLIPFFIIIAFFWAVIRANNIKNGFKNLIKYFFYLFIIGMIALCIIWLVYLYHTWHYPPQKQKADTEFILSSLGNRTIAAIVIWMSDKPIIRAIGHYLLGVSMAVQRASGGNTGYFLGEVSAAGWKTYFPFVYFAKETITFHLLSLISFVYFLKVIIKHKDFLSNLLQSARKNFVFISFIIFNTIYWTTSLKSNLNIGVRHLLPVFPFTIILIAGGAINWLKKEGNKFSKIKLLVLSLLLIWQAYSVLSVYPYFLTYFNEALGGPAQGYKYVVDSNLDWGQDLKRLHTWLEKNNIKEIYIDYFGGSDIYYYLKDIKVHPCSQCKLENLPTQSYFAVSATLLQGGRGRPVKGFDQPFYYYKWLDNYTPIEKIGNSIFVYQIK